VKALPGILIAALVVFGCCGPAFCGGLFGPPQSVSRETGGLHTAIGYEHHEDLYKNGDEFVLRQNRIYSELAYGSRGWELYGRLGISDLKFSGAFSSAQGTTTTSKSDFEDNWNIYGALGAKGFYPLTDIFGVGAFLQGSYQFGDFKDNVTGSQNGVPFIAAGKVKNLWDVNFGVGLQARVPRGVKIYAGPYVYYSEAEVSMSANIPGLKFGTGDATIKNKTNIGGFTGFDIPLIRGFHLNVEGQYSERFSIGAVVAYSY
jgi:hypothetical protein